MVGKRKLPARNRGGSVSKRRISDIASSPKQLRQEQRRQSTTPVKKATATPVPSLQIEPPTEDFLPNKIHDSQPLPTLPKPQTQTTPSCDYQSFAESGVVAAALHRSKTKWLHDCLFEKYWTKPSKKKNQPQPTFQNPPKDSMTKLGPCTMVIEPHYFDVMLYTVRQPHSQPPSQQIQQKQMVQVHYTPPNNSSTFHEYFPRNPRTQVPPNKPPNIAPLHPQTPRQQPPQTPSSNAPSPGPVQPLPQPPNPQARNAPQQPQNALPPPGKPSADPVIQLLANRAATNPDLRSLMRIVADSQADHEQLRAFQAHIDEINAIIASKNPKDSQIHSPQVKTEPVAATPAPAPVPAGRGQNQVSTPIASRSPAVTPGPTPNQIPNQHTYQPSSAYPHPPQGVTPIRSKTPLKPPLAQSSFRPQFPQPVVQAARMEIKGIVFEFVSPAGATHGPTGDRYLFPKNMILDYFPGNTTVIASFLAIKKIDPPTSSTDSDKKTSGGKGKGKKAKLLDTPATPPPNQSADETPAPRSSTKKKNKKIDATAAEDPQTTTETTLPSKDFKPKVKEYYQPVTLRLHASNPRILEPLGRVVKPPTEVRDYMNGVMDEIERADIEYLALRLPREQRRGRNVTTGDEPGKISDPVRGMASRGKMKGTENEGGVATPQASDGGHGDTKTLEEELKNSYDVPCSLVPLRI